MRKALAALIGSAAIAVAIGGTSLPAGADEGSQVSANESWQSVGYAEEGQGVWITAEGSWTVDDRNWRYVGPEGYGKRVDRKIWQGCKVSNAYPYGRLVAKIGHNGRVFSVGEERHLIPRKSGVVLVRINDADRCLGDNAGWMDVTVN